MGVMVRIGAGVAVVFAASLVVAAGGGGQRPASCVHKEVDADARTGSREYALVEVNLRKYKVTTESLMYPVSCSTNVSALFKIPNPLFNPADEKRAMPFLMTLVNTFQGMKLDRVVENVVKRGGPVEHQYGMTSRPGNNWDRPRDVFYKTERGRVVRLIQCSNYQNAYFPHCQHSFLIGDEVDSITYDRLMIEDWPLLETFARRAIEGMRID